MYQMTVTADSPEELKAKLLNMSSFIQSDAPNTKAGPVAPVPTERKEDYAPKIMDDMPVTHPAPLPVAQDRYIPPSVDRRGLPWDMRIHAASKALAASGFWRYRRNIDQSLILAVEQELVTKARAMQEASPLTTSAPPVPHVAVSPVPLDVIPHVAAAPVPLDVIPHVAAPVEAPKQYENIVIPTENKPAHSLETFKTHFNKVMVDLLSNGKISQKYVEDLKSYFGLAEIWDILKSEVSLAQLFEQFVQHGLITKVG